MGSEWEWFVGFCSGLSPWVVVGQSSKVQSLPASVQRDPVARVSLDSCVARLVAPPEPVVAQDYCSYLCAPERAPLVLVGLRVSLRFSLRLDLGVLTGLQQVSPSVIPRR